jgi:hypothetical protein
VGDTNQNLASAANRFFDLWAAMLRALYDRAKLEGKLDESVDSESMSRVVISSLEGALLMCKASKDLDSFKKTAEALKRIACR